MSQLCLHRIAAHSLVACTRHRAGASLGGRRQGSAGPMRCVSVLADDLLYSTQLLTAIYLSHTTRKGCDCARDLQLAAGFSSYCRPPSGRPAR